MGGGVLASKTERTCSFFGSFGSHGAFSWESSEAGTTLEQSCCSQAFVLPWLSPDRMFKKKGKGERERAEPCINDMNL